MEKVSVDEYTEIKNDFYRGNFWAEHVVTQIDYRVAFYLSMEDFLDHKS